MKERIPLQIIEGKLVLASVVECKKLRIHKQFMEFVIDTGSPHSYFSDKDVKKLQVPMRGLQSKGFVDFGGSRFKHISLPKVEVYLLKEGKDNNDPLKLKIAISALNTTKCSEKKIQIAQTLPSILGMDFLREQEVSLHVILTENIVYLEFEKDR